MTTFVFYVNPQIPNIEYFAANHIHKSREVSHFCFSSNFPSNGVRIISGDLFLTRVMTIFIKTYIFGGREEEEEERKEGRKEGRKGGREEDALGPGPIRVLED